MQFTPQIIFRNLSPSDAITTAIHNHVAQLEQYSDRLLGCRVMVEVRHRRRRDKVYHCRIDLTVPDGELVVNRDSASDQTHADLSVAIRDAFEKAEREVKTYGENLRRAAISSKVSQTRSQTYH